MLMRTMRRLLGILLCAAAMPLFPASLIAREAGAAGRGGEFTIKLVLIGPGDEFFSWWGHLALIVEDAGSGRATFFDYGVFSFQSEHFYRNMIDGNWIYRITAQDAKGDIDWYIADNRDITYYTLNLEPAQKEYIVDFLAWNARPENSRYHYNIFTDNCVSRVLFLLDAALDGRFLERFAGERGRMTVREQADRHIYRAPLLYWLLNLLMGQSIDAPPSKEAEMFLPEEFVKNAADFEYTNARGALVPLVSSIEVIHQSRGRYLPLEKPPRAWIPSLLAGLSLAALFGLGAVWARGGRRRARLLFGAAQAAWGLFLGLCGTLLFYAAFFSQHTYARHNSNALFITPLSLAAVPAALFYALGKNEKRVLLCGLVLKVLWSFQFLGALLSVAIKISPRFFQDNTLAVLTVAPAALTLSLAGYFTVKPRPAARSRCPHSCRPGRCRLNGNKRPYERPRRLQ